MSTAPSHPAFPLPIDVSRLLAEPRHGLTKREYFASVAMQGLCAAWSGYGPGVLLDVDEIACDACDVADTLIRQLNRPSNLKEPK